MLKILIADDEPLVRAGIKSVIPWQQHGFEVIGEAENGLEAYNKIIALKPDILITDIKMPQMDGIELLKTIKKDKIHIQSIILSCFDEFDMVREAMKYGANHPMGPLELGDFIGLDICLAIMDVLYKETGDSKYRACPLIRKMVRGGNLGAKSGKGFYVYNADRTKTPVDAQ